MKGIIPILLLTGVANLTACASKPPAFSDLVLADGESRIEIAKLWDAGEAAIATGEKKIKNGKKLVEKGQDDLSEGQQLIKSGNGEIANHRQAYLVLSQAVQDINIAETALERSTKLKSIANKWEDGEEKLTDGQYLVERGKSRIAEGKAEIINGEKLINNGREKMQDAESRYSKKSQ